MKLHEIVLLVILIPILSSIWSALFEYLIKQHNDRRGKK